MIKVGVVGATGYTGVELLRILCGHERIALVAVTSRAEAGKSVAEVFPNLRGVVDLCFSSPSHDILGDCDFVFFATPNGTAMTLVPTLIEAGARVVDLAADFRLKDPSQWEVWYGSSHACPELLSEAVYGLPEVNRDAIRNARLVANPGCYATAVQLGFLPLVEKNLVFSDELIADAKSGVSGAGRKTVLSTLLCEASETFKAYSVPGHRHLPEIEQGLKAASGQTVGLTFVPHLTPMIRGIHATLYARLREDDVDLQAVFEDRYQHEPFVDVMPVGSHPETRSVRGANLCRLSWHRPQSRHTVVVLSVIDNLVKGAAGQAVQNMNLMLGFEECTGLGGAPMLP